MRLAVYTQKKETANLLSQLFDRYRQAQGGDLSCRLYDNDVELLCDMVPGEYDALFLDGGSWPRLTEELRERDGLLRFIGIVPLQQNAAQAARTLWYCLPDPVSALFLFPVLDRLAEELKCANETGIVIKTKSSVLHLPFSEIEYVEVMGRSILFHLLNGKLEEISGKFSDFEARLLLWPDFFKVHRAYLVNLRHIAKLTADGVLTRSGSWVPVSQLLYPQLKKDYLESLMLPEAKSDSLPQPPTGTHSSYTILLVDDVAQERSRWAQVLMEHGCDTRMASNGEEALALAERERFDCVILDVNLGNASGFDLCDTLRQATGAPVIYLSTLSDCEHQTQGFLTGGTDYITKDVTPELFWVKVERRITAHGTFRSELCSGSLRLDLKQRRAYLKGLTLTLTTVEFDLLHLLMTNSGAAYPPGKLYGLIWGSRQWDDGHTVQLHLSQLQRKLESAEPSHRFIQSVWGEGYRFVPEDG